MAEIALAVGSAVGGAFMNVLFERLASRVELLKMFQKNKHYDDRLSEKLGNVLLGLQIVLSDAENKQASNQHVREWLNKLQSAMDSAENLMEEVHYEALKLEVEGQHQNLAETCNQQVFRFFSECCGLHLRDDFFLNIKGKLEGTIKTLEDLQKQIGDLGLKEYFGSGTRETRTPSTSVVEPDVFGRQNEIEQLIDRLTSTEASEKNLTVLPIVGMGGLGKTTLAQAAYNDEKVQSHFKLKAWISSGKTIFVQGGIGSKIIVTTRNVRVALMMRAEQISMDTLSIDDSWSLFERHAFENMDPKEHPELGKVAKQIAAKCKGLPLALKTLAGMLRSESKVEGWRRILTSEIWDLQDEDKGILPVLMLSYNELPPHLKPCFSYCAIFPKDYPFRKEQVVHLWIANGFVVPQGEERIQDLGDQYFNQLRSRSLFEKVRNPSQGNTEEFLMHDLVNDLARIASSKLCVRLEECQGSHMLEQSRNLSYSMGRGGEFEKLTPINKLEQLRTLLPVNIQHHWRIGLSKRVLHNILPRLTSLRALLLSDYTIKQLPDALFIKFKLLRFLDLSRTEIKKLPDSICALYNLETLLLSSCTYLEELPLQIEKLINLRHLDIRNTSCLKVPLHLRMLKTLQVLVGAKYLLSGPCGWRMEDLGEAHYFYGSLSILGLQNVVDRREAQKAKTRDNNSVEKLSLEWSESDADNSQTERDILLEWSESDADNSQTERDILDELRPQTDIKELQISGYRGTQFPNWLADDSFLKLLKQWHVLGNGEFPALQDLSIIDCPKLLGKLPENLRSLTNLRISRCPELNLETPIQLSSLKRFEVDGAPKAGVVFDEAELFTSQLEGMKKIEELYISGCNSLTSLPISTLPSTLKTIWIGRCRKLKLEMPVGEIISNMFLEECDYISSPELVPRARNLDVTGCQNLTRFSIPNETERLDIWGCENLEIVSVACGTHMTSLDIYMCKKLKRLPERMQELLPSLKLLLLQHCPEIESFPEGGLPFNLQLLHIDNCKKLVNGRKEWRLKRLPSLRELYIFHNGSDEEIFGG
ncbi:hypothetical protein T459_34386 [Capsicum annuum]|uniref:Disease resistance RPP13-like protein 1 n=1 Tax=Capsicum annuum TaxID=4072 RepID=A0A2G2XW88_CAPAN|nr:hypothetical protein T459_34386 [Capsicum annuum]